MRELWVRFHDILEKLARYYQVLSREFTRLCTYLGPFFSVLTTPIAHTPPPPPSDTTVAPPIDCTSDPCSNTVNATISHSDLIEHLLVDPIMFSSFEVYTTILFESIVTPTLDIQDMAL